MNYKVRLKIKSQTKGGRYEFMWDGNIMRTPYLTTNLIINAKNDNELINKVLDLSDNTLEIISYEVEDAKEDRFVSKLVDYVTQIVSPMEIINKVQTSPATISNN